MKTRIGLSVAMLVLVASASLAVDDPTYVELRNARPDGRVVAVSGLTLQRDAFTFVFDSGAFHFLSPIGGRTVGAVFLGSGHYKLLPATENERHQLGLQTGHADLEILEDRFESAVILFGDETDKEILARGDAAGGDGTKTAAALKMYERYLDEQRKSLRINFHARVLQDLLNGWGPNLGTFIVWLDGAEYPPALLVSDPMGIGNLSARFAMLGGEQTTMLVDDDHRGGLWYLSSPRGEAKEGIGRPFQALAQAEHYDVQTTIGSDLKLSGTTTIRFKPVIEGLRVLPIHLLPKLRISEVYLANVGEKEWTIVPFVQEELNLEGMARFFREATDSDVAVVFEKPLVRGSTYELKFEYAGTDVLSDAGDDNYYIGARESWYPNVGTFVDVATYSLTYSVPKGRDVVSVGGLVEEKTEGDQSITVWAADEPVRVAGFNYGKFRKLEKLDEPTGINIQVFTNPGTPDIIRQINGQFDVPADFLDDSSRFSRVKVDTRELADSAMADATNMARVGHLWFGQLPYASIAITQQSQWSFGQSWPNLIYLPYLAFVDGTTRAQLFGGMMQEGVNLADLTDFVQTIVAHELAHQWWGHVVGFESYRDQWLSEGFAEFSAALLLQHQENFKAYDDFWERARKRILEKRAGGLANWEAGPISQGLRLSTERTPSSYSSTVYSKGGFVLHMLRMLMRDPAQRNADAAFIVMMNDFVSTWAMKSPSTNDFKKIVEKHMTANMSVDGQRSMDWFFDQWVHGTDIPRITHDLKLDSVGGGKYRLHGTIRQEGVGPEFASLVPIYADFGKGQIGQLGRVPIKGNSSFDVDVEIPMKGKPKQVVLNAMHEILTRD